MFPDDYMRFLGAASYSATPMELHSQISIVHFEPGDKFIFMTDGGWSNLKDDEIIDILQKYPEQAQTSAKEGIELAYRRSFTDQGVPDDMTLLIIPTKG